MKEETEKGVDIAQWDFRVLMAARLIKLCRYYVHFFPNNIGDYQAVY